MQVKKQQLELDMELQTGSKLGKEYVKAVYCHPAFLTYVRNAGLDEAQAGIKIAWININNPRNADDTTVMAESEELKSLLMKVKEESEKAGLKLSIQKTKIMASSPITSWQIDGETKEAVRDFIFWGSQITADGDCSHEIKKTLPPWKKGYDQPRQHIKKQRHSFASKGLYNQSYVFFPVVMYGCESWTTKKAELQRIDVFEPWCWRIL